MCYYRLRMFDRFVVSLLFSLGISAVFFLLPFFAGSTLAAELTGRDIALKMDEVDTSRDSKRTAIMVINRKEQKLVRKMESCNKKYGQDERGLIKFVEPPDVRGIMYLTWSYEDIDRGMTICGFFFRLKALCGVSAAEARRARL